MSLKQQLRIQIPFWLCLTFNIGGLFFWTDLTLQAKPAVWLTAVLLSTLGLNALLGLAWFRQHLQNQFHWHLCFEPQSISLTHKYKNKSRPIFHSPAVQDMLITQEMPGQSTLSIQTGTEIKNFVLAYEIPERTCKQLNFLLERSLQFSRQRHTI